MDVGDERVNFTRIKTGNEDMGKVERERERERGRERERVFFFRKPFQTALTLLPENIKKIKIYTNT